MYPAPAGGPNARRRTKIVATLGPATESPEALARMIRAGTDVVRLNFSHGKREDHIRRAEQVRRVAAQAGREVAVLGDLQGPKIRIDRFRDGPIQLAEGATFVLDAGLAPDAGTAEAVGIAYKSLPGDVSAGDTLLLDDGNLEFSVQKIEGKRIVCSVVLGGELSDNKGINRQGGGLSAGALTDKDRADIHTAAELGVDYLAVSFPRGAEDMEEARRLLQAAGGHARMVAKIERIEAVRDLDEILAVTEVIMVARGDLGVEIGDAQLPGVQKDIIQRSRDANRIVITATQMMESMIHSATPTRAEVSDVANAVMDGTDAVMLSGESAVGAYPVKAVEAMARVCVGAEKHRAMQRSQHRIHERFQYIDEAVAMATMYVANHLDMRAIVALTESGSTALWMSRIHSGIPIFALTRHEATRRRVKLYRGVYPVPFDAVEVESARLVPAIVEVMKERGIVVSGERVLLTRGDTFNVAGGTNTMKIVTIP